jgi:hypothetical protein
MDGNAAVGFEPAVGEATVPDYIVTADNWKIYFDSVVLGGYADNGCIFPVGLQNDIEQLCFSERNGLNDTKYLFFSFGRWISMEMSLRK